MPNKHPHCELIKLWADGAQIQTLGFDGRWRSLERDEVISWLPEFQYRIKPTPKPDVVKDFYAGQYGFCDEFADRPVNLRLTFDGETGQLKSAEVLK